MEESTERPSRRSVLVLLGVVGVLAPAAVMVQSREPAGGEMDGLRFDVLEVGRHPVAGSAHHVGVGRQRVAGHGRDGDLTPLFERTSWPDIVRVQLQVRNLSAMPLLVSPGQFRLRVQGDLSVMPTAWRHGAAALGAGETRSGWIDYRAPDADGLYQLEFSPAGHPEPVAVLLAVPSGVA